MCAATPMHVIDSGVSALGPMVTAWQMAHRNPERFANVARIGVLKPCRCAFAAIYVGALTNCSPCRPPRCGVTGVDNHHSIPSPHGYTKPSATDPGSIPRRLRTTSRHSPSGVTTGLRTDSANCRAETNESVEVVLGVCVVVAYRTSPCMDISSRCAVMRLVLQACVAALVNVQSVEMVDAELKRRSVKGN